eukprot:CAMPEP_0168593272 /NCGR_PEP_ID=MMETSP0420-20121227/8220_1 /TAXON_ID=498008 /ORGANISM="Pessonella sp." /LENGTH=340 /DNA_ID=CAMNT_0008629401 /DNA_START=63 /DNA_END=1082 /DNA_ORIENTATION=-
MADDNSEGSGVGSEEIDDAEILEQLEQLNADDNAEATKVDCDFQSSLYCKKKKKGLKKGKKWAFYKFYLHGSSLWYYSPGEGSPKDVIELKKFSIGDDELTKSESRPNTFSMKKADLSTVWIFSAASPELKNEWLEKLKSAPEQPTKKPPVGVVKRKSSLMMRAKKKVAGKAATSGVGKRLIKSVMNDDEVDQLFNSGKAIVVRDTDQKRANTLEDTIIKLAVKGILLTRSGAITPEMSAPIEPLIRSVGKNMKETWNDRIRLEKKPKELEKAGAENYKKIAKGVKELEAIFKKLFEPFVTESTLNKLSDVCKYLGDEKTWKRVYETPEQKPDLEIVLRR